jgi:hypothetical protein
MPAMKVRHDAREVAEPERDDRAHANHRGRRIAQAQRKLADVVQTGIAPLDFLEQCQRFDGRFEPSTAAIEQRQIDRALQVGNQPADARLRSADDLRGAGCRACEHQRPECVDVPKVHPFSPECKGRQRRVRLTPLGRERCARHAGRSKA